MRVKGREWAVLCSHLKAFSLVEGEVRCSPLWQVAGVHGGGGGRKQVSLGSLSLSRKQAGVQIAGKIVEGKFLSALFLRWPAASLLEDRGRDSIISSSTTTITITSLVINIILHGARRSTSAVLHRS